MDLFPSDIPPITVYEHQRDVIARTRESMAAGNRRVIIRAPTGIGKTRMSAWIAAEAIRKGKRALFMVYGKDLVRQAQASYVALGIPAAILMSGYPYRYDVPVQVASVSTLAKRLDSLDWLAPDLIITDECRESLVDSYQAVRDKWPHAFEIGLDATPARADGKGLGTVYRDIIHGPEYDWLIKRGYLVQPRYFSVPESDSTLLRKNDNGEFTEDSSAAAFEKVVLVGGVVRHWHTFCEGRPTVVFASSVAHSQAVCAQFNDAGVPALHIDANTPADVRDGAYRAMADGTLTVLCNYGVLHRGFDCPPISAVVLEREVNHIAAYIQMIGRGLRAYPEKRDCTVLDLGENYWRFGDFAETPVMWDLSDERNVSEERKDAVKEAPKDICCSVCAFVYNHSPKCPNCGHRPAPKRVCEAVPDSRDAKLAEVTGKPSAREKALTSDRRREVYQELLGYAEERGYKPGWAYHNYKLLLGIYPAAIFQKVAKPIGPSDEVLEWLKDERRKAAIRRSYGERSGHKNAV